MKIGILTHPLKTNYGCLLQAFALRLTLERMGHEALIIDRRNKEDKPGFAAHLRKFLFRTFKRYVLRMSISPCWNNKPDEATEMFLEKDLLSFIEKIPRTERTFSECLPEIARKYNFDAYVSGSDQVWKKSYSYDAFFWFVERKDAIKLTYGASAPSVSWMEDEGLRNKCISLSSGFKAISTREKILAEQASKILNRQVETVLDPTLLLDATDYVTELGLTISPSGSAFSYILDPDDEKKEMESLLEKHFNSRLLMGMPEEAYVPGVTKDINRCVFKGVRQWLSELAGASFVLTDSYHGMLMAIIFRRPFGIVINKERGSERFKTVLELTGLESRVVRDKDDLPSILDSGIDYDGVYTILSDVRRRSFDFLSNNL